MFDLSTTELLLRLGAASGLGMLQGLDWERRGFPAGMRTHGLFALSGALLVLLGLGVADVVLARGGESDPLRVVQGLFQAMGFLGAGMVFARGGDVRNLTSAASLVLTCAIGMTAGAGLWRMTLIAAALGICLSVLARLLKRPKVEG
ncbi:MgtC/SapB family protein [Teichococcus deserti]|uniref:MgtC/SapB family protein n=1 Tax=Teichococcus deserti TaxID=1817963 RepID=UPI001F61840C|nr:MgtC/SapB family protein [Pseudoroseomonas deserti]